DIRNGLQYECIGCAACIDGCNQVMKKLGYAPGLIRYTSERALEQRSAPRLRSLFRPRVLIFATLLAAIASAAVTALALRSSVRLDVLRDRASIARELEDGSVMNVYRLQIRNSSEETRTFFVTVEGLSTLEVAG